MARFGALYLVLAIIFTLIMLHSQSSPTPSAEASSMLDTVEESWNGYGRVLLQATPSTIVNCSNLCDGRCSAAGRQRRCQTYCKICCGKCNCVPSGTSGHKDECYCYDNLKNSKGTAKCP
ncbi:hypothetical protein O6H91_15G037500 [Diphasiastrum complanatum]|uniref:Uncharacterized protein n=1 Tax=Diphasiastrum complanatum TaxID=34168 RepID=A0ACC2BHF7_DIPCM|nr:hypothetical protein O6H91_15G037500 [Diphasiastrum complanatum]